MQAAYYETQGAARDVLRYGEMARPEVALGEVLVRVRASGINPSDVKYRSGWGGRAIALGFSSTEDTQQVVAIPSGTQPPRFETSFVTGFLTQEIEAQPAQDG